jgi:hypothetical protein
MRQLAAVFALGTLLACSSVGTCWLRLAATAVDHCCHDAGVDVKAARPCAAEVASVAPVLLAPPAAHAGPAVLPALPAGLPVSAAAMPALPPRDPPLVLRI